MRFGFPLESTRTSFAIRAILYSALTSPTVVLQVLLVRLVEAVEEGSEFPLVETQVDKLVLSVGQTNFAFALLGAPFEFAPHDGAGALRSKASEFLQRSACARLSS
jgi:hypothetical protein